MKRCLLILSCLMLCLALRSQSLYTCRYWFDQNHEQASAATFSGDFFQMEVDAGTLTDGLHTLYLMVKDTTGTWCAPRHYLFYQTSTAVPVNPNDVVCYFWFDQDFEHKQTMPFGTGQFLMEADSLDAGIHVLNVVLEGDGLTSTEYFMFYQTTTEVPVNPNDVVCYFWFDQDFEHKQTMPFGTGQFLMEADSLDAGIHVLNVVLEGDGLTSTECFVFYKVLADDPGSWDNVVYRCWFDQDYSTLQTGLLGNGIFELNTESLPGGMHILNVQLDNGSLTAPRCYMFYKTLEKEHIARWEYMINDDINQRYVTNLSPCVDTLDIIALLPVETWPIRSTCFHFHPNGEEPYLNAKNKITFRFWNTREYYVEQSAFYVDENVSEPIVADTLERNTITTISAPRDNQIHWFKVEANRGDYLSFQADKACTMQLFAPSGEEVYSASGFESVLLEGFYAWEDGTYYLAVHDVTGSGEMISITYNWIYRYAILSYDVHVVGNGGRSTITFQGNGFNSLLDVYYINESNDTIRSLDIGHESNTTTTVSCNFYDAVLGIYDVVFEFLDETIRINNALEVQEAVDIHLTSTHFRSWVGSTCTHTFQITNNGNMTAYNVPLEIQIYTPYSESLTRVDIGGFNVKSYIMEILGSYYSDSLDIVIEQKRLVSGDLFGFLEDFDTDLFPDAPYVHYTFISPNLRPNTTETFTISLSMSDVWSGLWINSGYIYMWYPDEWQNIDSTEYLSRTRSVKRACWESIRQRRECFNRWQLEELGGGSGPWANILCPPHNSDCYPPPAGGFFGWFFIAYDPNDIYGYLSESGSHYMRQEIQNVQYEIEFENDSTLATAAAHTIIVRDTLDATKFDLNSLAARSVTIGDKRLDLNGEQTFARTLDLRPELYVIAQINQDYDPTTGIIQWTIQSLDPMTMEPTDDPYQGVLPVNYSGNGVGFIDYSINLKQAFADGTEISNRAGIIFDQNDVIMTPTWTNIVDAVEPTSQIESVEVVNDSLSFSFVSSDNRSGVWYHTLYYRNDSTEMEWKVKVPKIVENSYMLRFNEYQTTEYLVMAVDSAGNHEDKEMVAEYVHYYDGLEPVCQTYSLMRGWNWWSTNLDITLDELKAAIVETLPGTTVTIKSRTKNTSFNPGMNQWRGSLNSLDVTQMYMIFVSVDCEITMEGMLVNPAEHPVTINNGTNWIAFPVSINMSVDNAFSGFAVDGDNIKSRNNNASYSNGHWRGRLTSLEPGRGYMYISNAQETRVLTFPASTR